MNLIDWKLTPVAYRPGLMDRRLPLPLERSLRNFETWLAVDPTADEPRAVRAARIAAITDTLYRTADPADYGALDERLRAIKESQRLSH